MQDEHRMAPERAEANDAAEDGGDPACWLAFLCPECGRITEQDVAVRCEYCGAELPVD